MSEYDALALDAAEGALQLFMLGRVSDGAAMLDAEGRTFRGDTKQSLFTRTERQGSTVVGTYGSSSDHGIFVHEGRGPGKPTPVFVLTEWYQLKRGLPADEAERAARATAKKHARQGTATGSRRGRTGGMGTPFLTQPYELHIAELAPAIQTAVAAALNNRI